MNDWLIEKLQLIEEQEGYDYLDFVGCFYYLKGGYGLLYVFVIGVYFEGLVDVWVLVKVVNDIKCQEVYCQVIIKGI